jgi:exonuclease III
MASNKERKKLHALKNADFIDFKFFQFSPKSSEGYNFWSERNTTIIPVFNF